MDGAGLNSWGMHMQRSLLMLVTLATVPLVSAEAQRSRSQESDSTESKAGVVQGLGFGAGLASGVFSMLTGPDEAGTGASWNANAARYLRRSKPATVAHSAGSMPTFDGAEFDELDGNGRADLSRLFAGDGRADAARTASAKGAGKSDAAKGDGWMPLFTPAADAPGIVKQGSGPGSLTPAQEERTVTLPTSDPICSNGTCVAYVDPLALVKPSESLPAPLQETEVLNELTGEVGTIVNPEPGTVVLTVLGLAALGVMHRRRGQRSA